MHAVVRVVTIALRANLEDAVDSLQPDEERFLQRRRAVIRTWPFVGGGLLAALVLFSVWLYLRSPLLIDPTEIIQRLEGGGLDSSTLLTLAGLVPVLFLGCLVLLFLLIVLTFVRFRTESRYIAILLRRGT